MFPIPMPKRHIMLPTNKAVESQDRALRTWPPIISIEVAISVFSTPIFLVGTLAIVVAIAKANGAAIPRRPIVTMGSEISS